MHHPDVNTAATTLAPDGVEDPVLLVSGVRRYFDIKRGVNSTSARVFAVDGVTLGIEEGETLGLVGESGCGKSTLARVIVGLYEPSEGSVRLRDVDVHGAGGKKRLPGSLQMVFQDPAGSMNPRLRVWHSVAEPLRARGDTNDIRGRCSAMLERVGLAAEIAERYPSQLSGGQQQRVCIARALVAGPDLVVFDEAISSLDVSLQAQVIELISELQEQLGTTYLFITHDLARAMEISDRIAIMYLGKIVELVPAARFLHPLHPYSKALISATLHVDRDDRRLAAIPLEGDVPSAMEPPSGCRFHTRCPFAQDVCKTTEPELVEYAPAHWAACHFAIQLAETDPALVTQA